MAIKVTNKKVKAFERLKAERKTESEFEEHLLEQALDHFKNLPPLPAGWVYDFIPSEPHYNPDTDSYEGTIKAVPRQIISIQEQPVCEDLEEAAKNYFEKNWGEGSWDIRDQVIEDFKAGANWQKEKDEAEITFAYADGCTYTMDRMRREAVEGRVFLYESYKRTATAIIVDIPKEELGDKVRIIIIKEDKQ